MTLYTKTTVLLDPVTEKNTILKYQEDSFNWVKVADTTTGVAFEHTSPLMRMEPVYLSMTHVDKEKEE